MGFESFLRLGAASRYKPARPRICLPALGGVAFHTTVLGRSVVACDTGNLTGTSVKAREGDVTCSLASAPLYPSESWLMVRL
jgi:hypothetical protein